MLLLKALFLEEAEDDEVGELAERDEHQEGYSTLDVPVILSGLMHNHRDAAGEYDDQRDD